MRSFRGRTALVTGAGRRLGRCLALALAREGAAVGTLDLAAGPLASVAEETGGRAAWVVADVTDRVAVGKAMEEIKKKLGPVDLLIANAGVGVETRAQGFSAEAIELQVRVNLVGVANCVEAVLPGMLARGAGWLVAVSSLASFRGFPGMAGYSASKAGLNAMMDALRIELGARGVGVTTVCPGWIRTPLTEKLTVPQPYRMEPEDAAARILNAVRKGRALDAFPGPMARRARLLRWLPGGMSDWLVRRMVRRMERDAAGLKGSGG